MTGTVDLSRDGPVAEIVLRQPGRRNAISATMWQQITKIASGDALADVTCVVIRGDGAYFSAGADIAEFDEGRSGASAGGYDDLVESAVRHVEALPMPVIAAISGHCIGAGASLACGCDIRLAERSSYIAVPAARLGLGYDPRGIARFHRVFGDVVTRQILFTADKLPATRAYEVGAVAAIVEDGSVRGAAMAMAARIAANAPLTIRAAKTALREIAQEYVPSSHALTMLTQADESDDYVEGRAAFAAKRPAKFRGK